MCSTGEVSGALRTLKTAAAVLVLALAGCETDAASTSAARAPVAVTRDNTTYPKTCRPRALVIKVQRFLTLQKGGKREAVGFMDFETPPDGGGFYADVARRGAPDGSTTATTAEQLAKYFAARHEKKDRLRLVELSVAYEKRRGLGNFEYKILRRADDVNTSRGAWNTEGKGAVECDGGKIAAWSMSTIRARERTGLICPRPGASARKRRAVVACARR